jgi:dGTPase
MEWKRLLSRARVSHEPSAKEGVVEPGRSVFERDWDRIMFSTAFRRMHDKTQVFPLPIDDVVHSRLTHSLEVSSVGRSLGKLAGKTICQRHSIASDTFDFHDVGTVVAAASLAHDIGNPPFGHAGESAIATFFQSERVGMQLGDLSSRELSDLVQFEGNAQGFRVLTRLQLEADKGLRLTAATLAAFCKYPRVAGNDLKVKDVVATKKHGCTQQDAAILNAVANEVGMLSSNGGLSWCRHPLAFFVEAADDICYSILDIEDGERLGHVPPAEAIEALHPIARQLKAYDPDRDAKIEDPKSRLEYLRAMAVGQMINECVDVFLAHEEEILNGKFTSSLAKTIPSHAELKNLTELAKRKCYAAPDVLEIELAGYEALGGMLEHFVHAVITRPEGREAQSQREARALELLRRRGVNVDSASLYERVLRVVDFVSGMTDRHALGTYRRLKGIAIPGRVS